MKADDCQPVRKPRAAKRARRFAVGQPASLQTKLTLEQLAEIAAAFAPAEAPVGHLRFGAVVQVDAHAGLAYVQDEATKQRFKLSRRLVVPRVFDTLRKGTTIRFRGNGHNAVAVVVVASTTT